MMGFVLLVQQILKDIQRREIVTRDCASVKPKLPDLSISFVGILVAGRGRIG
jgi:hypothetical protein